MSRLKLGKKLRGQKKIAPDDGLKHSRVKPIVPVQLHTGDILRVFSPLGEWTWIVLWGLVSDACRGVRSVYPSRKGQIPEASAPSQGRLPTGFSSSRRKIGGVRKSHDFPPLRRSHALLRSAQKYATNWNTHIIDYARCLIFKDCILYLWCCTVAEWRGIGNVTWSKLWSPNFLLLTAPPPARSELHQSWQQRSDSERGSCHLTYYILTYLK